MAKIKLKTTITNNQGEAFHRIVSVSSLDEGSMGFLPSGQSLGYHHGINQLRAMAVQHHKMMNSSQHVGQAFIWDDMTGTYKEGPELYIPRVQKTWPTLPYKERHDEAVGKLETAPAPEKSLLDQVKAKAETDQIIDLRDELENVAAQMVKITRKATLSVTSFLFGLAALLSYFNLLILSGIAAFITICFAAISFYDAFKRKTLAMTKGIATQQFHGVSLKDYLSFDWSKVPQGKELETKEKIVKKVNKVVKFSDALQDLITTSPPRTFFIAEYNEDPSSLIIATTGRYSTTVRNLYIVPKWIFAHKELIKEMNTIAKAEIVKPNILDSIKAQEEFQQSYEQAKKELA